MSKLSFAISTSGLPLDFFGAGAFLAFIGGVLDRSEASPKVSSLSSEFSASESAFFARFFGAALGFAAAVFFGLGAAAFFAAALGF
jgi:hypothetical protein